MAQTDSVPTPIKESNPDASTTQSTNLRPIRTKPRDRRYFIGGSDARIIMGADETALLRLWREKRGEIEPEDLCGNLVVQLGVYLPTSSGGSGIRCCAGWRPRWMVVSKPPARSCCPGR